MASTINDIHAGCSALINSRCYANISASASSLSGIPAPSATAAAASALKSDVAQLAFQTRDALGIIELKSLLLRTYYYADMSENTLIVYG